MNLGNLCDGEGQKGRAGAAVDESQRLGQDWAAEQQQFVCRVLALMHTFLYIHLKKLI